MTEAQAVDMLATLHDISRQLIVVCVCLGFLIGSTLARMLKP
jgi:hypothetical protein